MFTGSRDEVGQGCRVGRDWLEPRPVGVAKGTGTHYIVVTASPVVVTYPGNRFLSM